MEEEQKELQNNEEKEQKTPKPKLTAKRFFLQVGKVLKRYWYWAVTLVLLTAGILIWCNELGYFDEKKHEVTLTTTSANTIYMYINMMYYFDVKADDGSEVTYKIKNGEKEIVSFDGNIMFAEKPGVTIVTASAGGKQKTFLVNVYEIMFYWKLPVGEEFSSAVINNIVSNYIPDALFTEVTNVDVIDVAIDEATSLSKYTVRKEGDCLILLSDINGVNKGTICIEAKDNLPAAERAMQTTIDYDFSVLDIDLTRIDGTAEKITRGATINLLEMAEYDLSGIIYSTSSNPNIAQVRQEGICIGVNKGKTIITIVCYGENQYAYYNIALEVDVMNAQVILDIGETITVNDLILKQDTEDLAYMATNSDCITTIYGDDGLAEAFTLDKDGSDLVIYGYNENDEIIEKFTVELPSKTNVEAEDNNE